MAKLPSRTPATPVTTATRPNVRLITTWANVQKALSTVAKGNRGAGVVTIAVLFDEWGKPLKWTKPEVKAFHPKGNKELAMEQVLEVLAK